MKNIILILTLLGADQYILLNFNISFNQNTKETHSFFNSFYCFYSHKALVNTNHVPFKREKLKEKWWVN